MFYFLLFLFTKLSGRQWNSLIKLANLYYAYFEKETSGPLVVICMNSGWHLLRHDKYTFLLLRSSRSRGFLSVHKFDSFKYQCDQFLISND